MLAAMELAGNQTVINAVSLRILQYSEDLCKFERLEASVLTWRISLSNTVPLMSATKFPLC